MAGVGKRSDRGDDKKARNNAVGSAEERRRAVSAWMERAVPATPERAMSPAREGKAEGKERKGLEQRDW